MDKPLHDSFATLVLGKLARGHEFIPEAELRPKVYADVVLRPGPRLPASLSQMGAWGPDYGLFALNTVLGIRSF